MASSISRNRTTPGVYVTELPAFAPSVVAVQTAIPVFVGYTQTAQDPSSKKPVYLEAIEINSLADYYSYFGLGFIAPYYVAPAASGSPAVGSPSLGGSGKANYDFQAYVTSSGTGSPESDVTTLDNYLVETLPTSPQFNLYDAVKLFYANGGGTCYVISVANYWGTNDVTPDASAPAQSATASQLQKGLDQAKLTIGPTMIVVPDACLLQWQVADGSGDGKMTGAGTDYANVVVQMLEQASAMQDRVAILDLPGACDPTTWTVDGLATARGAFYEATSPASDAFSYGAAYAPALEVSVYSTSDLDFTNLWGSPDGIVLMNDLLTTQAKKTYTAAKLADVLSQIEIAYPANGIANTSLSPSQVTSTNQYLVNALPLMSQVLQILCAKLNVAPPSGVMAGLWTRNDSTRGVWNAPANLSPASVVGPKVNLTDDEQSDYNVPLNGESVCLLRTFPGRGTVVWGARTLDGNSNDYRYIQVRRTLIYIEQSIKTSIQPFVFASNTGQTWVTITSMITNFLTNLWSQGGLMGDKASDAFTVQCGLGTTMTSQDVLNGYMIVSVTLQMVHPAEFIELTFTQMMQS
ncbi:phage tail sheath family protein [Azospirillum sp. 412522]|nr:phage tail sheath C-terminal domain-containing protein [Azospirillum sp. 412522]MBY6263640.1 phage tail sheath family protein [Azospirillum sp. 412522]